MTGYFRMLVAVVALAALPGLSGCLGGGGGSSAAPAAQMPREPAPEPMAEPAADPDPEPMAEPAADPEPKPMAEPAADPAAEPARSGIKSLSDAWSLAGVEIFRAHRRAGWSSNRGNRADFTAARRPGWLYRGSRIIDYGDGGGAHHDHVAGIHVAALPDGSGVRVRSRAPQKDTGAPGDVLTIESGGGRISEVTTDSAVFGRIEWDAGDDGNWTSWGWWLELRGADFIANAPQGMVSADYRAFVEGPEFHDEPLGRDYRELYPATGTARYRGPAAGMFTSHQEGRLSFTNDLGGVVTVGEFTGSVDLTINFGRKAFPSQYHLGTIDGNLRLSRMEGARTNTETGAVEKMVREFGASDGPVIGLPRDLGFSNRGVGGNFSDSGTPRVVASGLGEATRVRAVWDGRLSSVLTAGGVPRSMAGVFEVYVDKEDSSLDHHFYGAFLAPLVTP